MEKSRKEGVTEERALWLEDGLLPKSTWGPLDSTEPVVWSHCAGLTDLYKKQTKGELHPPHFLRYALLGFITISDHKHTRLVWRVWIRVE